ncbi:alpha-1,2-fucosyltransferase [Roseovarius faecimaris]|uniref:Alpha-1,2-fucosyltransferase n=1 Tax=Roseovarius faecimaris TaxID=2494550 RepID=A0A6I6IUE6_9RHOB|nr:alpha-1,2-fucosyltransferase [Roseovarius faecimaris]QGX99523.1 alpha-1,2-fucosyltransferase [Roseovarius faecimaris]
MAERRVYSRLFGGAGNQLFQYAAGRALADRLGCELVLDARYVARSQDRGDCFAHFSNARFTRDAPLPPAKQDGLIRYGLWRLFGRSPALYRENGLGFDPRLATLPAGTYLHGYWQSERYFGDTARLREDLRFTTPLDAANAAMADRIAAAQTPVSFHVRRGDYLAAGAYAACSPEYYRAAAAQLADTLGPLTCFVFSNDPAWARDNLALGQETVVVYINDETGGHFDMHLQSLCAHHVIANSTFSWWGAWLNPSPDKQVIAPKDWFSEGGLSNPDLLPANWTQL